MSFRDMIGMYRVAIMRCINAIAFQEGKSYIEDVIRIIDGIITTMGGNVSIYDSPNLFTKEQKETLLRFHQILCEMRDLVVKIENCEIPEEELEQTTDLFTSVV